MIDANPLRSFSPTTVMASNDCATMWHAEQVATCCATSSMCLLSNCKFIIRHSGSEALSCVNDTLDCCWSLLSSSCRSPSLDCCRSPSLDCYRSLSFLCCRSPSFKCGRPPSLLCCGSLSLVCCRSPSFLSCRSL